VSFLSRSGGVSLLTIVQATANSCKHFRTPAGGRHGANAWGGSEADG